MSVDSCFPMNFDSMIRQPLNAILVHERAVDMWALIPRSVSVAACVVYVVQYTLSFKSRTLSGLLLRGDRHRDKKESDFAMRG